MIKYFRKIRHLLLIENKLPKYFFYALGEIVLVVVGILVAVQINNWNEGKNQEKALINIFYMVANDLEQDIDIIDYILKELEKSEPIFNKVLNDLMTKDDYKLTPEATRMILGTTDLPLNTRGYSLLKSYLNYSEADKNRLSTWILSFYQNQNTTLSSDNQLRLRDVENTLTDWKNKYVWYAEFITENDNSKFIEYALHDQDYKNRVANYYLLNYTIYKPLLINYKEEAKALIKEIRAHRQL